MRQPVIKPADVWPGTITFDDLLFDPEATVASQIDDLKEDLLLVEFPNGCVLAVGWLPAFDTGGRFMVHLSQGDDGETVAQRFSADFNEMRDHVLELARLARDRPGVAYTIFGPRDFHPGHVLKNTLVVNPERPVAEQAELLDTDMLTVFLPKGETIMRVSWEPPRSSQGEFVVALGRDFDNAGIIGIERRCRNIEELRNTLRDIIAENTE